MYSSCDGSGDNPNQVTQPSLALASAAQIYPALPEAIHLLFWSGVDL